MDDEDTIFDKIVRKEIPSTIVFEDEKCLCFKDINPQAPTHLLLIPKKRDGLTQLSKAEDKNKDVLGHLLVQAGSIGKKQCPEGFRIVINDGKHELQHIFSNEKMTEEKKSRQFFIPGQEVATKQELEKELQIALKKEEFTLASSIIGTLLKKEYSLMKSKILFELKIYKDCLIFSESFLKGFQKENGHFLQNAEIHYYIAYSKLEMFKNIWIAYKNLLIANCFLLDYAKENSLKPVSTFKGIKENEDVTLEHLIQDLNFKFSIRADKEKNSINLINFLVKSETGKFKLTIYKELINRTVYQVACGENHVLILASSCCCINNFISESNCEGMYTCNGGTQIFGVGDNSNGQLLGFRLPNNKNFISQPIILSFFSNFLIKGIAVYEWGEGDEDYQNIQKKGKFDFDIKSCAKSNNGTFVLFENGALCFYGILEGDENNKLISKEILTLDTKGVTIDQISAGANHLLAKTQENELVVMGSNLNGQIMLGDKVDFLEDVVKISKFDNVEQVSAFGNTSFILTKDGDVSYCGQIEKKNFFEIKQAQFPSDNQIINLNGFQNIVYALDEKGFSYHWDFYEDFKFKKTIELKNDGFRQNEVGKYYKCFLKTLINPEKCCLIEIEKGRYSTYKQIHLALQTFDNIVFDGDFNELEKLTKKMNRQDKEKNDIKLLLFEEILENNMKNLNVKQNKDDLSLFDIDFIVEKEGTYYLYAMINGTLINDLPLTVKIERSNLQSELENATLLEEQKKKERELARLAKDEEKIKLEEQRRLEEEAKLKATKLRAEENSNKILMEQKKKKELEEKNRQMRAEIITGGGFDLNKLEKNKPIVLEKKKSIELDKRKSIELDKRKSIELDKKKTIELDKKRTIELDKKKTIEAKNIVPNKKGTKKK